MSNAIGGEKGMLPILAVIAFAALMDGIDGSIVNVALPTLAKDFGTDTGTIAWVAVTYFLMVAGLLVAFAKIAKNGLIKMVLLVGLILFTVSSLFCGISESLQMLLVFRIIQGVGAAMMGAAVPMACVKYLPKSNLGLGMGVLTLGCAVGFALGPAVGGIITDLLSWHWIFLINVPLGIIVIPLLIRSLPKDEGYSGRLDVSGTILIFAAIVCGIIAVERIPYYESALPALLSGVACLIFLVAFIINELKKTEPLLNLSVFKHWKFDSVLLACMISNMVYMGILYLLPFYMHVCMGFSPLTTGTYILISPLLTLLFCIPISRWSDRTERRAFAVVSCIILAAGGMIMVLFSRDSNALPLIATLVCMGLFWAFCGGPMGSRVVENVEEESREMGSSIMYEFIYLGSTLGTALFAMFFTLGSGSENISFSDLPSEIFLDGFIFSMAIATILAVATFILSLIVKEPKISGA
jgi:EmrB/QacA subfamily drug resistance transporter